MLRNAFMSLGDEGLDNKFVTDAITNAQKKIEGQNFDTRKSLMDYDDVLRQQRKIMYEQRDKVLYSDSIYETVCEYFKNTAKKIIKQSLVGEEREKSLDGKLLKKVLEEKYLPEGSFNEEGYTDAPIDEASEDMKMVYDIAQYMYEQDKQNLEQTDSSFVDDKEIEMA
jgi:preprotein translocase subunit SecA